jgi:hypothetical protein
VTKPAFLKVRTRKVADRFSRDENIKWDCPCPFCRQFCREHPFDPALARRWRLANPAAEIDASVLRPGGALFDALPLLSEPTGGALRQAVSEARMGHNHSVLVSICRQVQKHLRQNTLERHMEKVVKCYGDETGSAINGRAVRFAYDLARGAVDT